MEVTRIGFRFLSYLAVLAITGFMLTAAPCRADQDDGPFNARFEMQTSNTKIEISSSEPVNLSALLSTVKDGDTMQEIADKVNQLRKETYPQGKEVRLELTDTGSAQSAAYTIHSKKSIYWWEHVNKKNSSWLYQTGAGAVTVYTYVYDGGKYSIYKYSGSKWVFYKDVPENYTWCAYDCGTYHGRGFKGVGKNSTNKTDVVMYFFQ